MQVLGDAYPGTVPFDLLRKQARELIGGGDSTDPTVVAEDTQTSLADDFRRRFGRCHPTGDFRRPEVHENQFGAYGRRQVGSVRSECERCWRTAEIDRPQSPAGRDFEESAGAVYVPTCNQPVLWGEVKGYHVRRILEDLGHFPGEPPNAQPALALERHLGR